MMTRRCWTEIDLARIRKNYEIYRSLIPSKTKIMAVVKADAYGHGDLEVCEELIKLGVDSFAVSNLDEAERLRLLGIKGLILILGYTPIERMDEVYKYDITQSLLSEEYAKAVSLKGFPIRCHFAIDTGMRRIGLNSDDIDNCERIIREYYSTCLRIEGLYTHLCVADNPGQNYFTEKQIDRYERVVNSVDDLNLPYCHCLNSAGGIWQKTNRSDFVRLGIILYGLKPDYENMIPSGIEPVLSWKSVVSIVKMVKEGDTIGYGRSYLVKRPMRIATISTGYADGYPRNLSNTGCVLINGKRAPIVGRICMDQMMVDVSDIPDVEMGTEVILIGESGKQKYTADDMAHTIGTIGYEIVCGISKRVERVFHN